MLLPSIIGILLCAACLGGCTFAWFTATASSNSVAEIEAASYTVSSVINNEGGEEVGINHDGSYTLAAGSYTVTLSAAGTASSGYCVFDYQTAADAYTEQIASNTTVTVSITVAEGGDVLTVLPCWGTSTAEVKLPVTVTE